MGIYKYYIFNVSKDDANMTTAILRTIAGRWLHLVDVYPFAICSWLKFALPKGEEREALFCESSVLPSIYLNLFVWNNGLSCICFSAPEMELSRCKITCKLPPRKGAPFSLCTLCVYKFISFLPTHSCWTKTKWLLIDQVFHQVEVHNFL